MRCPTLAELPPPPRGKNGWPWTEESLQVPDTMPDGSLWPRVSIVTPSYNQGQFIEETIRSILMQGYPDLEYIIMDGGSTDTTLGVIRRYEQWMAYWVSEPDRGQSHAINKGLERATGAIISWLNSDDLLYPDALRPIALAFVEHPDAGMIYGTGAKISGQGNAVIKEIPYRPYNQKLLRTRYFILQQSAFMRREALLDVGFLDESIEYMIDWELAIRLSSCYPICAISNDIGKFRIQPAAKTQMSGWDRMQEIARIGRRHNGWTDRNFLVYWPLSFCLKLEQRTGRFGQRLLKRLGRELRRFFDRVYGADTYMMR